MRELAYAPILVFEVTGNGEQYNNQISLYSQPEITKSEVMNDLKLPENWSYRVYPVSWDSSANYTGFNPQPPPFFGQQPINYAGIIPQGHPANWTPLPGHAGFNFQNLPSLGATIQSYRDVRTRSSCSFTIAASQAFSFQYQ